MLGQRFGGREQTTSDTDDHDIVRAKVLGGAIEDRTHALGHGLSLGMNASDARVATSALKGSIELVVVAGDTAWPAASTGASDCPSACLNRPALHGRCLV